MVAMFCPYRMNAAQFSGLVRAADQVVPGATVTARNGGAKVLAFTDEQGHYALDLTPGTWEIEVSMFEFAPATGKVTVGDTSQMHDWVLNMPKLAERGAPAGAPAASTSTTVSVAPAPLPNNPAAGQSQAQGQGPGRGQGRGVRGPDGRRIPGAQQADGAGGGRGAGAHPADPAVAARDAVRPGRRSLDSRTHRCAQHRKVRRRPPMRNRRPRTSARKTMTRWRSTAARVEAWSRRATTKHAGNARRAADGADLADLADLADPAATGWRRISAAQGCAERHGAAPGDVRVADE